MLPNLAPSVFAAWIFAFIGSFDEVIVTSFMAGKYETVPKKMFNELILEVNPTITAVATLLIAVTVLALAAVTLSSAAPASSSRRSSRIALVASAAASPRGRQNRPGSAEAIEERAEQRAWLASRHDATVIAAPLHSRRRKPSDGAPFSSPDTTHVPRRMT